MLFRTCICCAYLLTRFSFLVLRIKDNSIAKIIVRIDGSTYRIKQAQKQPHSHMHTHAHKICLWFGHNRYLYHRQERSSTIWKLRRIHHALKIFTKTSGIKQNKWKDLNVISTSPTTNHYKGHLSTPESTYHIFQRGCMKLLEVQSWWPLCEESYIFPLSPLTFVYQPLRCQLWWRNLAIAMPTMDIN